MTRSYAKLTFLIERKLTVIRLRHNFLVKMETSRTQAMILQIKE